MGTGEGRKGCLGAGGRGVGQFTADPGHFHGEGRTVVSCTSGQRGGEGGQRVGGE